MDDAIFPHVVTGLGFFPSPAFGFSSFPTTGFFSRRFSNDACSTERRNAPRLEDELQTPPENQLPRTEPLKIAFALPGMRGAALCPGLLVNAKNSSALGLCKLP